MFTALSERLTAALKRLTGRGVLSEQTSRTFSSRWSRCRRWGRSNRCSAS